MNRTTATKRAGIAFALLVGLLLCLAPAAPALAADDEAAEPDTTLWAELTGFFKEMLPGKASAVQGAYTRGEEDEAVIAADPYRAEDEARANRLTAGNRALHLRWRGGEAPYRLYLLKEDDGGMRTLAETGAEGRVADLPALDLTPGTYLLVIKDKKDYAENSEPLAGPATTMALNVLPVEKRPVMPPDFAENVPERMRALRYPTWLAAQGDGEWTLEAMQLVAPLVAESPYAAVWMQRQWGGE